MRSISSKIRNVFYFMYIVNKDAQRVNCHTGRTDGLSALSPCSGFVLFLIQIPF